MERIFETESNKTHTDFESIQKTSGNALKQIHVEWKALEKKFRLKHSYLE